MAARIRKDLGVPVEETSGRYGEFTVLVGERTLVESGPLGWLGVLPSTAEVLDKVRRALAAERLPGSS